MTHHILRTKALKWTVVASGALLAMRLFFVQQLLAALLIFSVLFGCLAVVALILYGLDFAWQTALSGAESFVMMLGRSRRGPAPVNPVTIVNMLTPVPVHRVLSHR